MISLACACVRVRVRVNVCMLKSVYLSRLVEVHMFPTLHIFPVDKGLNPSSLAVCFLSGGFSKKYVLTFLILSTSRYDYYRLFMSKRNIYDCYCLFVSKYHSYEDYRLFLSKYDRYDHCILFLSK